MIWIEALNSPDILKFLVILDNIIPQADPPGSIVGNLANVFLTEQNGNIIGDLIQNPDGLIAGKIGGLFIRCGNKSIYILY